jgi:hypothetical protein
MRIKQKNTITILKNKPMYFLYFYLSFLPGVETGLIMLVIGAVAFLFWHWLFKNNIKKESARKIATWSATLISTALLYTVMMLLLFGRLSYTPPDKNFDKAQWLADKAHRYQMAEDIINSRMLIGKDSNQVNEILGLADSPVHSYGQYTYEMGTQPAGFGVVFHKLLLKRDSTGKVVSVEHIQVKD